MNVSYDIHLTISKYLSGREMARMSQTCQYLRGIYFNLSWEKIVLSKKQGHYSTTIPSGRHYGRREIEIGKVIRGIPEWIKVGCIRIVYVVEEEEEEEELLLMSLSKMKVSEVIFEYFKKGVGFNYGLKVMNYVEIEAEDLIEEEDVVELINKTGGLIQRLKIKRRGELHGIEIRGRLRCENLVEIDVASGFGIRNVVDGIKECLNLRRVVVGVGFNVGVDVVVEEEVEEVERVGAFVTEVCIRFEKCCRWTRRMTSERKRVERVNSVMSVDGEYYKVMDLVEMPRLEKASVPFGRGLVVLKGVTEVWVGVGRGEGEGGEREGRERGGEGEREGREREGEREMLGRETWNQSEIKKVFFSFFTNKKRHKNSLFWISKLPKIEKVGVHVWGDCLVTDGLIHMIKHVPVTVLRNSGGRFLGLKGKFKRARNEEEWVIRNDL